MRESPLIWFRCLWVCGFGCSPEAGAKWLCKSGRTGGAGCCALGDTGVLLCAPFGVRLCGRVRG
jgi:hypothetical protein